MWLSLVDDSAACNHVQSEEEGLKVKQAETAEAVQLAEQVERSLTGEAAGLVVPVQNGEGDSLNLSAGFIQVPISRCINAAQGTFISITQREVTKPPYLNSYCWTDALPK